MIDVEDVVDRGFSREVHCASFRAALIEVWEKPTEKLSPGNQAWTIVDEVP